MQEGSRTFNGSFRGRGGDEGGAAMGESSSQRGPVVESIRETAEALRVHRKRPCLLYISRQVAHSDVVAVRAALEDERLTALDVIVSSPGGDVEAAYLVARELRRRVQTLTVYIPFRTKSAATLIALAADELVLGSLGELGPLDAQYEEKQAHDFPLRSRYEITCPFFVISLRLLMPFRNFSGQVIL
jgi:hypothetical protein